MTELEIIQEAERLVNLDEKQLAIEEVAIALRLGVQSEASSNELHHLDMECLNAILGSGQSAGEIVRDEDEGEITAV